ncbi:MAG TPA: hypothetical protein VHK65_00520, partial [Candidatus Dormibacteraeota bacterium]|nr:hypothetical protein [Candidatus Dormibacteraeota bacterium]
MTRRSPNLAGAAAAVLLVVGVAGLYLATHRAHPTASSPVTPAFGKLLTPMLNPPLGIGGVADSTALAIPYVGPAKLSWSGHL